MRAITCAELPRTDSRVAVPTYSRFKLALSAVLDYCWFPLQESARVVEGRGHCCRTGGTFNFNITLRNLLPPLCLVPSLASVRR